MVLPRVNQASARTSTSGVAIGDGAKLGIASNNSIAIGKTATAGTFLTAATGAIAIGNGATIGAGGNNSIAIGNGATAVTFASSVALGASATCTAANQITLGTSSQTIRLNTISPLYATIPTFTSAQVGYISTTSGVDGTALNSAGNTTILTTASMPIGLYTIFVRVTMTSTHPNDVGVTINLNDAAAANVIKGQTIINSTTAPPLFMSIPYSNSSAQAFTLTGIFNAGVGHNAVIANTGSSLTNVQILRIA